ncbi:hypothetical protein BaRGS_00008710 [Batillaria attramentaria]|uniref:Uncharacterized protein n=1 Tax=Batillaria attramentaria TaxID=370345 RepID=A0ABD0LMD6_9CAEN
MFVHSLACYAERERGTPRRDFFTWGGATFPCPAPCVVVAPPPSDNHPGPGTRLVWPPARCLPSALWLCSSYRLPPPLSTPPPSHPSTPSVFSTLSALRAYSSKGRKCTCSKGEVGEARRRGGGAELMHPHPRRSCVFREYRPTSFAL